MTVRDLDYTLEGRRKNGRMVGQWEDGGITGGPAGRQKDGGTVGGQQAIGDSTPATLGATLGTWGHGGEREWYCWLSVQALHKGRRGDWGESIYIHDSSTDLNAIYYTTHYTP